MAVQTRDIIAGGGGDYTTIVAWEAATNLNAGVDIWKGVINDTSDYDETVTINGGGTGTSSYVWLTVDGADRHAGVPGTGHARMTYTGTATAAIQITSSDYARIDWMQIQRTGSSGASDEAIRVDSSDNCLIDYCLLFTDQTKANQDGVYIDGDSTPTRVSNTVSWGWGRSGIHAQNAGTKVVDIDHCTVVLCGRHANSDQYGLIVSSSGSTTTMNVYNTIAVENVNTETVEWGLEGTGSFTLNGSDNAATANNSTYIDTGITNNATAWEAATDQVTDTAPATAGIYITDATNNINLDPTLVDHANNVAIATGTDRQGSEPDTRQDFSVAANGSRPTTNVDLGALQTSTAGGGTTPIVPAGGAVVGSAGLIAPIIDPDGGVSVGAPFGVISTAITPAGGPVAGSAGLIIGSAAIVPAGGAVVGAPLGLVVNVITPSGGVVAGGAVTPGSDLSIAPAGGPVVGSTAVISAVITPAGGPVVGSAGEIIGSAAIVPAGGAVVGAPFGVISTAITPAGGPVVGGAVTPGRVLSIAPAGGPVVGGAVSPVVTIVILPAGGAVIGSAGVISSGANVIIPSGGAVVGSAATIAASLLLAPSGGAVVGSAGSIDDMGQMIIPSGGVVVGTAAMVNAIQGIPRGSWYGLVTVYQEAAAIDDWSASSVPVSCPNDGEPLVTGADGELYCRFDGWRLRDDPEWRTE